MSGHAFQNACYLNAPQVTLSNCQPFECSSMASSYAFQNGRHLNAALLCQVTLFKMPAI
jgi:hypothetical protein